MEQLLSPHSTNQVALYQPEWIDLAWQADSTSQNDFRPELEETPFDAFDAYHEQNNDTDLHNEPEHHRTGHATLAIRRGPQRRQTIPASEWERFRPTITELYVERELKLKELVDFMDSEHGFEATEQMYKKRLAAWGLRKNYSQQQKDLVIRRLDERHPSQCSASPILVNSKPLKIQKIHRYQRLRQVAQGRHVLVERKPYFWPLKPAMETRSREEDLRRKIAFTALRPASLGIRQPSMTSGAETFLSFTERHYHRLLKTHQRNKLDGLEGGLQYVTCDPSSLIRQAGHALKKNSRRAFTYLQRSCDAILKCFSSDFAGAPRICPLDIIYELSGPNWDEFPTFARQIMQFTVDLAVQKCGKSDPLTSVLALAHQDHTALSPSAVTGTLCLDVATRSMDRSCGTYHSLQLSVVRLLGETGDLQTAEKLCTEILVSAEPLSRDGHRVRLCSRGCLLNILWLQGREDEAKTAADEFYELAMACRSQDQATGDYLVYGACEQLGIIYAFEDDLELSAKYYRLACEAIRRSDGEVHVGLMHCLEHFEEVLMRQGKMEEIHELHVEYASTWEYWNSYPCG